MKELSLFIEPKSTDFSKLRSPLSILKDEHILAVATECKSIQRARKFHIGKYLHTVMSILNSSTKASEFKLSNIAELYNSSVDEDNRLDAKCIHNKIRTENFLDTVICLVSELLYATTTPSFQRKVRNSTPAELKQLLKLLTVNDIIMIDGTEVDVSYSCADNFTCKGKGRPSDDGTPPRPGIKLHIAYSLLKQTCEFIKFTEAVGNEKAYVYPERFNNCLIIADRGYISEELEKNIEANNNYFIIKGKSNTAGTITSAKDLQGNIIPDCQGKKVSQLPDNINADLAVTSASGHNLRVVHHVNPLKDANEDKDSFSNLRTNIPANVMNAEQIYQLYRLRWQIELFNKANKSGNCLQSINSANHNIILTFILLSIADSILKTICAVEAMASQYDNQDMQDAKDEQNMQDVQNMQVEHQGSFSEMVDTPETISAYDANNAKNKGKNTSNVKGKNTSSVKGKITRNEKAKNNSNKAKTKDQPVKTHNGTFGFKMVSLLKLHCNHSAFEKFFTALLKRKLSSIYKIFKELCNNIIKTCLRTKPSARDRDSYRDLPTLIKKIIDLSREGATLA